MSTGKLLFIFADNVSSIATDQDFPLKVPSGVESTADLFSWYQKEARFPDYFGRNWDAFLDCLRDFSWTDKKRIVIAHDDVPLSENEKELRTYLEILATVVDEWKEVKEGPLAEHPKEMPFFEHELVVIFPSAAEARIMDLLGSREQTTRDNTRGQSHCVPERCFAVTLLFFDRQELSNPMNGLRIKSKIELDEALEKLGNREPFVFELVGENEYKLLVGFGKAIGCVQHSRTDGDTPYLVAVAPGAGEASDYFEFLAGDTATPISQRYCMPWEQVKEIVAYFLETGDRSPDISWEEI